MNEIAEKKKNLIYQIKHYRGACVLTYALLSLAFIIVIVSTLSNLPPWIDEVMMLDTSYNAAVHGSWETTAWYRVVGQYPFSTYPPLYQMVATVWIWLFGGGLVTVRSMNLFFTFVLGGVCLRLMKRHKLRLTHGVVILFTTLLWGTCEMIWMCRNGRPDMLCGLMFVLTVLAIDSYMAAKTTTARVAVVASSALLLCSGVQAAVYLLTVWLFFFIVSRERRRESVLLLVHILTGILLGTVLTALFMLAHGRLLAFASSIVQYSATLSGIVIALLPWAGEMIGFDAAPYIQKLLELSTRSSFVERLSSVVEYRSFIILSSLALVAYGIAYRNDFRKLLSDKGFIMLLCALYVPLIMVVAGRFPPYYRWMAFLPLLASVIIISARHWLWSALLGVVAVVLTVFGIKSMLPDDEWQYANVRSFVERQHFKASDVVVCPFSTFYEIKPVCDTCYFVGIFPTEFIGHVDYIIEAPDNNDYDHRITNYVNALKADTTVALTVIDHCERPSLTLYRVKTKPTRINGRQP